MRGFHYVKLYSKRPFSVLHSKGVDIMKKHTRATPSAAIRPAIYLRVSTAEQADSGLGLAAQAARCAAMCEAKGWPAAVVYQDEGISGTLGPDKRPGLGLMLGAIVAGQINAVVVLDLSRLGRNVQLIAGMIEDFDDRGVAFVSCKENFDTSTAMGRAMLNLVAVFGQLERDLTSERTVAALAERGKLYGYKAGRLPLGYCRDGEALMVEPEQAALVRAIFQARARGDTLRAIAAQMRELASGREWYASTIKVVLDNAPIYRGEVEHWPAIL